MNTKPIRLIVSLFWLLAFVFPSLAPAAITLLDGVPWVYEGTGDGGVCILHGPGCGDVTIPPALDCYTVRSIGPNAFANCTGLTSVMIPDSVTYIGEDAFVGCTGLAMLCAPVEMAGEPYVANSGVPDSCTILYGDVWEKVVGEAWSYVVSNGMATITAGPRQGEVTIPSSIGGYPVVGIGQYAFYQCTKLTSVTIPNSVKEIGYSAFLSCYGLTNVTIGSSVADIGEHSFYDCTNLSSVTLPNSVTNIGEEAFYNCTGLTAVNIHDLAAWCGIEFGRSYANPLYFAKHLYLNGQELAGDLVIPDGVEGIGIHAFYYCTNLTSVTIPNSVVSIGYEAFDECTALTAVNIHDLVAWCGISFDVRSNPLYFAKHLYLDGQELTGTLILPSNVTNIKNYVFQNCTGLTDVAFGNNVTNIGYHAFEGCTGLTGALVIPDCVTSIGPGAFENCTGLTEVTIGNNVTYIMSDAFKDCRGVTNVTFGNSVRDIGFRAFESSGLTGTLVIPDSVTSIGMYAFRYCTGLESVTIPNSVTNIGYRAFWDCYLETIYAPIAWQGKQLYDEGPMRWFDWYNFAGVYNNPEIVYYEPEEPEATAKGVPYSWLEENAGEALAAAGGDYETAANAKAANGRKMWECYWAGLNPGDADKDFTTAITFSNGVPNISWNPDLGTNRTYIVEGSEEMDGAWGATNASTRFFRTKIAIEEFAP